MYCGLVGSFLDYGNIEVNIDLQSPQQDTEGKLIHNYKFKHVDLMSIGMEKNYLYSDH